MKHTCGKDRSGARDEKVNEGICCTALQPGLELSPWDMVEGGSGPVNIILRPTHALGGICACAAHTPK